MSGTIMPGSNVTFVVNQKYISLKHSKYLWLVLLLITAQMVQGQEQPETVVIKGTVIDDTGERLPAVILTLTTPDEERTFKSDSEGHFNISIQNTDTGVLSAAMDGYITTSFDLTEEVLMSNRIAAKVRLSPEHVGGQSSISIIRSRVAATDIKMKRDRQHRPDRSASNAPDDNQAIMQVGGLNLAAARQRLLGKQAEEVKAFRIRATAETLSATQFEGFEVEHQAEGDILIGHFQTEKDAQQYLKMHVMQYDPDASVIKVEKRKNN